METIYLDYSICYKKLLTTRLALYNNVIKDNSMLVLFVKVEKKKNTQIR